MPIFQYWDGTMAACNSQAAMAQSQMLMAQVQAQAMQAQLNQTTPTWTSTTTGNSFTSTCITSGTGGTGGTGWIVYAGIIEVDEEDYLNNAEYYELARQRGVKFRIRTAEETRLRLEAAQRAREEAQQRERERQIIRERARGLLLSHLTAEQRKTFEKNRWFVVVGGKTKTEYRIRTDQGITGNIEILAKGRKTASLCCHCRLDIPDHDQFLAQKIALMFDEDNFLRTANRRAA